MKVYLDSGATTWVYPEVIDEMTEIMQTVYGNPSSMHRMGVDAEKKLKESRKIIARALKATPEEIVFTSGGTESNNLAIRGFLSHIKHRKNQIITSVFEHPSVLTLFQQLEKEGFEVTYIPVDNNGQLDLKILEEALNEKTALVSIMYVNNEIGSIQPLTEISKLIKSKSQAIFHVDAVQAFCKLPCNVKALGVDMMSVSGHKIHGPKGVGALYMRKGIMIDPLIYGGSQENALRPGTENLPGIVGFSKACQLMQEKLKSSQDRLKEIKAYFLEKILDGEDASLNGSLEGANHIVNITFKHTRGEVLLHMLETKGVYVSTGSACSSKNKTYSHVLEAIGLSEMEKEGAIRFSFTDDLTTEAIDYAVDAIHSSIKELKDITKGR
ncbi:MAG: cysteine desulfurase [Clostridia bacterium]|nr:cysteine desulfurase [Clostridia bacterium]